LGSACHGTTIASATGGDIVERPRGRSGRSHRRAWPGLDVTL
jgi:hypothetical protein